MIFFFGRRSPRLVKPRNRLQSSRRASPQVLSVSPRSALSGLREGAHSRLGIPVGSAPLFRCHQVRLFSPVVRNVAGERYSVSHQIGKWSPGSWCISAPFTVGGHVLERHDAVRLCRASSEEARDCPHEGGLSPRGLGCRAQFPVGFGSVGVFDRALCVEARRMGAPPYKWPVAPSRIPFPV